MLLSNTVDEHKWWSLINSKTKANIATIRAGYSPLSFNFFASILTTARFF